MLSVEMLPAGNGDCLWIEYGPASKPKRILIDGGTSATKSILTDRINSLHLHDRRFELIVLTHVDMDHIGGLLPIWQRQEIIIDVSDFWMNGRNHLDPSDALGAYEGEKLSRLLASRSVPWNKAFAKAAVVVSNSELLPSIKLNSSPPHRK